MPKELKKVQISFNRGKPSEINKGVVVNIPKPSQKEGEIVKRVGTTVKVYLKAIEELLSNKYAHLRQFRTFISKLKYFCLISDFELEVLIIIIINNHYNILISISEILT